MLQDQIPAGPAPDRRAGDSRPAARRRAGVLTFHRCINYGSYWQARALTEGLRRRGLDAVLLDHRHPRVDRAEWRNALQPTLPRRTPRADVPLYARKARRFFQAVDRLPVSPPFRLDDPSAVDGFDVVVVGSDEVWNFRHPWLSAWPVFFGEGVGAGRLVSYAASFGCHEAAAPLDPPWVERLRRFHAHSVRDENSLRLLRDSTGEEASMVLDPCLQFEEVCRRDGDGPAVVYGHSFPDAFAAAARAWAEARGVRLLSLGYRNDWADEQWLSAGPEDFAEAMGAARAVITNYFHGCVFALANRKPFVCTVMEYRRTKISGLMRSISAEDRLIEDAFDRAAFEAALDRPPGEAVEARIAELRRRSTDFLDHALR